MNEHTRDEHRESGHIHLPEINIGDGPVKWHKRCSRKHAARTSCGLVEMKRVSRKRFNTDGTLRRGGHDIIRLAHPKKRQQPKRKGKARKS